MKYRTRSATENGTPDTVPLRASKRWARRLPSFTKTRKPGSTYWTVEAAASTSRLGLPGSASMILPPSLKREKKRNLFPSGRNQGQTTRASPAAVSGFRATLGVPPDADTR